MKLLFTLFATSLLTLPPTEATIPCNSTHNPCSDVFYEGSKCINGFCSNPFQGGCLQTILASEEYEEKFRDASEDLQALRRRVLSKPRVCNSEDGDVEIESGVCVVGENEYPEVRIYNQNWEGSIVPSWIMQIIYSELLGVPSTMESGSIDASANFYDPSNSLGYGTANDWKVLENAFVAKHGDCTTYNTQDTEGEYIPCANIAMDIWNPGFFSEAIENGSAEAMKLIGVVGNDDWFVTQFTIEEDPSLLSHYGLGGEENRRKLARAFKRPTTWKEYCDLVSSDGCDEDDGVAKRAPTEEEENKYFMEGLYTGHFRATAKNDCDVNPNCTGHFLDYPCGWSSYMKQQTYHLGIALESDGPEASGGYSYSDMVDIWFAANSTRSNVIGMWWEPEALVSLFLGTGSDLIPVPLPTPTQECLQNRIDITKRCEADLTPEDIYGSSKGSCATQPITTLKTAAANLLSSIQNHPNPKARLSPAYKVYSDFTMNTAELNDILSRWIKRGIDKYGFDLRLATCEYVANDLERIVNNFIPQSHPRTFVRSQNSVLTIVAIVFGVIAMLMATVTTSAIIYKHKKGKLSKSAQIEFLLLLLAGLLLVSVGGFLMALEPSTGTCTASMWLVVIGYTTELIPTLIRVSTIIKIIRESKKLRVVRVDKKKLILRSIGLSAFAAVYCFFWMIFDTPESHPCLELTEDVNDLGETVSYVSYHCDSESNIWWYATFVFQAILLICASVLAYQMRQAPNVVNDSKPLAFMIYTSFFFLTLRFVMFVVSETVSGESEQMQSSLQKVRSIFISLDTAMNIIIFFSGHLIPRAREEPKKQRQSSADQIRNNIIERRASQMFDPLDTHSRRAFSSPDISLGSGSKRGLPSIGEEEDEHGNSVYTVKVRRGNAYQTVHMPRWVIMEFGTVDTVDDDDEFGESRGISSITDL